MAEAEVLAGRDRHHAQPADEDLGDERLGRQPHQLRPEAQHVEVLHAEVAQELRLARERREAGRRAFGIEQLARVRLEGDHTERCRALPGERACPPDHLPVTEMHAVEIADGDGRTARGVGQPAGAPVHSHGAVSFTPEPDCKGAGPRSGRDIGAAGLVRAEGFEPPTPAV